MRLRHLSQLQAGAVIRFVVMVVLSALAAGCGGSGQSSVERCRELDETFGPAEAWEDIAELQRVAAEWQSLECGDLLADG